MVFFVGLVGFIGSGKNTVSSIFVRSGFKQESLAAPLKDVCARVFSWPRELLDGTSPRSRMWRELPDTYWSTKLGVIVTPRRALQWLGTDVFRNSFHQDVWLLSLLKRTQHDARVVVPDVRFKNEILAIQRAGGVIVRVKRGPDPLWFPVAAKASSGSLFSAVKMQALGIHASEWEWTGCCEFDYVIENNGTLKDLEQAVQTILNDIEDT